MKTESVSAVIFAFNEEMFICDQIESLINQTVLPNQIVIVDDHSTDRTMEVVKKYVSSINENLKSEIEFTITENAYGKGKTLAYSLGCSLAKHDWICIVAADDKIPLNYIECNLKFLRSEKLDFCVNNFYICNEILEIQKLHTPPLKADKSIYFQNVMSGYLFIRREVIREYIPLPLDLEFEDWYINLLLFGKYGSLQTNTTCPFMYRRHNKASTFTKNNYKKKLSLVKRDIRALTILLRERKIGHEASALINQSILARKYMLSEVGFTAVAMSNIPRKELLRFAKRKLMLKLDSIWSKP